MPTALLFAQLPEGVPEWVHLVPAGTFKAYDGRGPFHLKDPAAVIAASLANDTQPPIDEMHATQAGAKTGQPAPARGRIVEMAARDNGLWGRIEWTGSGRALLEDKAYRGISPVLLHAPDGTIGRIISAALTNDPAVTELTKLFNPETGMDLVKVRAALGLPDTADEAACLAAMTAQRQAATAHASQFTAIAQAAGLGTDAAPDAIVTALNLRRSEGGEITRLTGIITGLETRVSTMLADQGRRDATAFVDASIKAGKPVVALRDHYITRFMADPEAVKKEIGAMVALNVAGRVVTPPAEGGDAAAAMSDVDRQVTAMFGNDPTKLAELRKQRGELVDGRAA